MHHHQLLYESVAGVQHCGLHVAPVTESGGPWQHQVADAVAVPTELQQSLALAPLGASCYAVQLYSHAWQALVTTRSYTHAHTVCGKDGDQVIEQ